MAISLLPRVNAATVLTAGTFEITGTAGLHIDASTSTDDVKITFAIAGSDKFLTGIDNSVSGDPYVFSRGTALGTNNVYSIDGSTGAFTLEAATVLNGALSGTSFKDQDDMSSNSATSVASQQSIKAYVDAQVTAQDLDLTSDSGTIDVDLDSETLSILGGTGLASSATGTAVTLAIDSSVVTLSGTQTLTGKTLTTPTIGSFAEANHDHSNDAGGANIGVVTGTSGTLTVARGGTGATTLNNLITLTTHTSGNYVATITGGTGITSSAGTSGEGTTHSLSVDASQTQITGVGTITTGVWNAGAVTSSGVVTATGFTIGSAVIDETDLEKIDGITNGIGAANKAVVLDGNADFEMQDNDKIGFGTDADSSIFHSGAHLYINNGTGNINLRPTGSEVGILLEPNGPVSLYYDNSNKIWTTSTGVGLSGNVDLNNGSLIDVGNANNTWASAGLTTQGYVRTKHDGSSALQSATSTYPLILSNDSDGDASTSSYKSMSFQAGTDGATGTFYYYWNTTNYYRQFWGADVAGTSQMVNFVAITTNKGFSFTGYTGSAFAQTLTINAGTTRNLDMLTHNINNVGYLTQANDRYLRGKDTAGTDIRLIGLSSSNDIYLGAVDAITGAGSLIFRIDGANVGKFDDNGDLDLLNNNLLNVGNASSDWADGVLTVQAEADAAVIIAKGSSGNMAAQFGSTNNDEGYMDLADGGSTKVRIAANLDTYFNGGNVGIGTASPTSLSNTNLNVVGATTSEVHIQTTGATSYPILRFKNVDGSSNVGHWAISVRGNDSNKLRIFAEDVAKGIVIDTAGNLGIGTASPQTLLDVAGAVIPTIGITNTDTTVTDAQIGGTLRYFWSDSSTSSTGLGAEIRAVAAQTFSGNQRNTHLEFRTTSTTTTTTQARITHEGTLDLLNNDLSNVGNADSEWTNGVLKVQSTARAAAINTAPLIHISQQPGSYEDWASMRFQTSTSYSDENWYIGARADSSASAERRFSIANHDATEVFTVNFDGNVGIGTSDMSVFNGTGGNSKLIVVGSDSNTNILNNSNASLTIANTDDTTNNTAGLHFGWQDSDGTPTYAGASVVAQFTDSHTQNQYPKGDLAFLTSTATNSAPSEKMRILADGKVGLGTDSPNNELHVHDSGGANVRLQMTNATSGAGTGDGLRIHQDALNTIIDNQEAGTMSFQIQGTTAAYFSANRDLVLNAHQYMQNNSLFDVGHADASWDATGIDVVGTGASTFKRTTSSTNVDVNSLLLRMISDGDAADGFGPTILFQITDTGVTNSTLGGLSFERSGADNTGLFNVACDNAGSQNDGLRLTSVGVLSVDLAGSGSAAQVDVFDEYDDPVELQRYAHMQSDKFGTENERQLSISRMLDMGVISEVPTSASGYHMNLQPMLRLVAGGIYQNRQRMDAQYDEMKEIINRLEKELEEVRNG